MKTAEEAASDYAESIDDNDYTIETESAFKAGYDFAKQWISIDDELPKKLVQVIVKLENGWHTCTWITENGDFAFNVKPTHWRYIDIE